jgi:hypothetical protein
MKMALKIKSEDGRGWLLRGLKENGNVNNERRNTFTLVAFDAFIYYLRLFAIKVSRGDERSMV